MGFWSLSHFKNLTLYKRFTLIAALLSVISVLRLFYEASIPNEFPGQPNFGTGIWIYYFVFAILIPLFWAGVSLSILIAKIIGFKKNIGLWGGELTGAELLYRVAFLVMLGLSVYLFVVQNLVGELFFG